MPNLCHLPEIYCIKALSQLTIDKYQYLDTIIPFISDMVAHLYRLPSGRQKNYFDVPRESWYQYSPLYVTYSPVFMFI